MVAVLLFSRQAHNALNVEGLGKEIDHVDFFHVIAGFKKQAGVAGKRGGIAGNVYDPLYA
jgi:hypothetical protein